MVSFIAIWDNGIQSNSGRNPVNSYFLATTFLGRGKHTPPGDEEFRNTHKTDHDTEIGADQELPAVTIRDPRKSPLGYSSTPVGTAFSYPSSIVRYQSRG
jgi:hypothetical protein